MHPLKDLIKSLATLSLMILLLFPLTFVHETGHVIAALVLGVPFSDLNFGFYHGNPAVTVPPSFPLELVPYFRYAGGFTAGTVMLIVFLIFTVVTRPFSQKQWWSKYRWWISLIFLIWSVIEFVNGYMEGRYFSIYIGDSMAFIYIAIIPVAILLQITITLLFRRIKKTSTV